MSAPAGGSEDRVNSRCKDLGTVASIYLRSAHPQGVTLHTPKVPTAAGNHRATLPSPGPGGPGSHLKSGYKVAYMATSILMALGSCRRMISASMGRAWCSQVAREPCGHRLVERGWPCPEVRPGAQRGSGQTSSGLERPRGAVLAREELGAGGQPTAMGGWRVGGAYALGAELLDVLGVGLDEPRQLLLLLRRLEDQAPLAEAGDVLLHQVQVDRLQQLLGGRAGRAMGTHHLPEGQVQGGADARAKKRIRVCPHTCLPACPPTGSPAPPHLSEAVLQL